LMGFKGVSSVWSGNEKRSPHGERPVTAASKELFA
jgi:hypothetical protein